MPIMPYSKNPTVSYFLYAFYAIVMAVMYGLVTYFGIFARGTEGFMLRTYIWNLVLIVAVLIIDKVYLSKLKKNSEKQKNTNKKPRAMHFISFKASLYLFYMFALIASRLMLLLYPSEIVSLYHFRDYILSIEYGLILLVAADKFIDQFTKDKKQMIEMAQESK